MTQRMRWTVALALILAGPVPLHGQRPRSAGAAQWDSLVAALDSAATAECRRPFVPAPSIPPSARRRATPRVVLDGHPVLLSLRGVLDWRPLPDEGSSIFRAPTGCTPHVPLVLDVYLRAAPGQTLPPGLRADSVWLFRGDEAYAAPIYRTAADSADSDRLLTWRLYKAPPWLRGRVDVLVRLRPAGAPPRWVGQRGMRLEELR